MFCLTLLLSRAQSSAFLYIHLSLSLLPRHTQGWINDEKPLEKAASAAAVHNFQTPLDEVDAAARVLDPVIGPLKRQQSGEPHKAPYGIFLKDYVKCEW